MTTAILQKDNQSTNQFGAFYEMFRHLQSYVMPSSSSSWLRASRYYQLTTKDLLDAIRLNPEAKRAFQLPNRSSFCVLVLKDLFTHKEQLFGVIQLFEDLGFNNLPIYKDSTTDDVHIYFFFNREIELREFTEPVSKWIKETSVFSNVQASFEEGPISIPCQDGFEWIAKEKSKWFVRSELTELNAIAKFLIDVETRKVDLDTFIESLENSKFLESEIVDSEIVSAESLSITLIDYISESTTDESVSQESAEVDYKESSDTEIEFVQMTIWDALASKGRPPP